MKMEVNVSGCPYEDADSIKIFANALDIYSALSDAKAEIRSRMKWEDISEKEYAFLEELQNILYVEGLEC